jgi:hypothetical protein
MKSIRQYIIHGVDASIHLVDTSVHALSNSPDVWMRIMVARSLSRAGGLSVENAVSTVWSTVCSAGFQSGIPSRVSAITSIDMCHIDLIYMLSVENAIAC